MKKETQFANVSAIRPVIRLGFVPLTDCAPLVMAQELGLFGKYGLRVELKRELGWATIRDKVIYGELDAAHAVAGMPVAATLGLGSIPCDCLTALVLNAHGNAITVSNELRHRGVPDAATLQREIIRRRGDKPVTFGVPCSFSSHHFLLRQWFMDAGIEPGRDVRIVVVPPPQMVVNLKAGHLDGFCAGEPWNSAAVQARAGWVAAMSADLAYGHPEKVLMVRREFAEQRRMEHLALVAALLDACEWCDDPKNREALATALARPEYVNVSAAILRRGLEGRFDSGRANACLAPDFLMFHRHDTNEPSPDKAAWVLQNMRATGLCPDKSLLNARLGQRVFRTDLFDQAIQLRSQPRPQGEPAPVTASTTAAEELVGT